MENVENDVMPKARMTAASVYESLLSDRDSFVQMGVECSKYTMPTLFPPEGTHRGAQLYQPYQSLGSRGTNNLASKILLSILPPSFSFFRLAHDASNLPLGDPDLDVISNELNQILSVKVEPVLNKYIGDPSVRSRVFEATKHLVVTGNALLFFGQKLKDPVKTFPLDRYVVRRDPEGKVIELVTKEGVDLETLPEETQRLVKYAQAS